MPKLNPSEKLDGFFLYCEKRMLEGIFKGDFQGTFRGLLFHAMSYGAQQERDRRSDSQEREKP